MFSDEDLFKLDFFVQTLPCQLLRIPLIDRNSDLQVAQGSANLLQLAEVRTEYRYVSRPAVYPLTQEVQDEIFYQVDLHPAVVSIRSMHGQLQALSPQTC